MAETYLQAATLETLDGVYESGGCYIARDGERADDEGEHQRDDYPGPRIEVAEDQSYYEIRRRYDELMLEHAELSQRFAALEADRDEVIAIIREDIVVARSIPKMSATVQRWDKFWADKNARAAQPPTEEGE